MLVVSKRYMQEHMLRPLRAHGILGVFQRAVFLHRVSTDMLGASVRPLSNAASIRPGRLLTVVGVGALLGAMCASAALVPIHETIDPHREITRGRTVLYVSTSCEISQDVLATYGLLERDDIVVVPVDLEPDGGAHGKLCSRALRSLSEDSPAPWWRVLPDSYLCARLSWEAFFQVSRLSSGRVPLLVRDGEVLAAGAGPDTRPVYVNLFQGSSVHGGEG